MTVLDEPYRLTKDAYYDSQPVCVYDDVSGEYAVFYEKADPFKNNGMADFKTPDAIANPCTNDSVVAYMLHADVDGESIYVVWTQAPDDEDGANGSAELYAEPSAALFC